MKNTLKCLILLLITSAGFAQENEDSEEKEFPKHTLGIALAHNNISKGVTNDGTKWLSVPSWGIDYNFQFSKKWAIGLHTDIVVEKIEVKENLTSEEETIERSYPIAPAVMGIYKPTKHSSFMLGMGAEFAKEENLALTRIGYEWGTELGEKWELAFSFNYDFRWNAYDSYTLGIGIARNLCK